MQKPVLTIEYTLPDWALGQAGTQDGWQTRRRKLRLARVTGKSGRITSKFCGTVLFSL